MKFEILFVVLNLALALSAPSGSDSWVAVSEDSDAQEPTNKEVRKKSHYETLLIFQ